jgi:hypothetical protein
MELFGTEHRAHMRPRFRILALAALLTIAGATAAVAQESRGSIGGRVVDSSGGVLPGVTVIIVNTGTNSTSTVITNDSGQFTAPLLISGTYRVTVELTGFRSMVREPVEVRVGDRLQVDFTLEPAGVSSEVVVIGQSPLLDSGTATMGQVIDSKLIGEMPLGDGTAYGLARLVPGASFERSYALQRPMDNDNLRGLTISGTINSEFTIDGSSNIVSGARVGIQPPSDSIQEFKIETAVYDAQIGHTGAGNVNLALKSGTNIWHGAGSFYNRDDSRSATLFASNRLGTGVTPRDYNRFSATLSGPVFRNRTFFMGSYERLQDDTIETVTNSVPTERMRRGDFSELLALGVQIFDPGSVPGQHHSQRPHQSHRAQRPELLSTAEPGGADRPVEQLLCRAAVDLWLQPAADAHRSRMDIAASNLRPVHPEFPARGTSQFRGCDQRCGNLTRQHGPVQLQLRRWAYGGPLAGAVSRRERQLAAVQRRFAADWAAEPLGARISGNHAVAARRLPAHPALLHRIGDANRGWPAGDAGCPAERLQHRPRAAVLQHAVHADVDVDARQSHVEVRLRLARAAPDGDQ